MSLGDLEITVGRERAVAVAVEPAVGVASGAEVAVSYDAPSTATIHLYAREIADGDLMCSLGARRAAVRMDLSLAARIVAEGLRRGMSLPDAEADALREVLGLREARPNHDR